MIQLDYQTNNPRWGWSGVEFSDWNSFSLTLGFLSNIQHYRGYGNTSSTWANSILICIEKNNKQGAWGKEGRIQYYKNVLDLGRCLSDLKAHDSKGNYPITCRINSNEYVISLIIDFEFVIKSYAGYLTVDVFPPDNAFLHVNGILNKFLNSNNFSEQEIENCLNLFDEGFNM